MYLQNQNGKRALGSVQPLPFWHEPVLAFRRLEKFTEQFLVSTGNVGGMTDLSDI